jgi:hypothetical protein
MVSAEMLNFKLMSTQVAAWHKAFVLYMMRCKSPMASHGRPLVFLREAKCHYGVAKFLLLKYTVKE